MRCDLCGKEYDSKCDYRQGRCPHHTPMLTDYHFRFLNLVQFFKGLFKRD